MNSAAEARKIPVARKTQHKTSTHMEETFFAPLRVQSKSPGLQVADFSRLALSQCRGLTGLATKGPVQNSTKGLKIGQG
jgi:hypothetical protein